MDFASVMVPAAPVRKKAKHQSEMTNQLLFGEYVKIIKEKGTLWVKIRSLHDGYEGWITRNLLQEVGVDEIQAGCQYVTTGFLTTIHINGANMQVPLGSSLPGFKEGNGILNTVSYAVDGNYKNRHESQPNEELIKQLTFQWLNAPYLWGGRTILGVDCSGFVQLNYKMMGIDLPRDAWQQAQEGKTVRKLKEAVCGDLAFFDDKEEIVHVGILLGDGRIIHSSGKVRIDSIDKKGIIQDETGKRTHSLRLVKRCINV